MENRVAVITGSTRGIGFSMADAFLGRGWSVLVNGRSAGAVQAALAELAAKPQKPDALAHAAQARPREARLDGYPADVCDVRSMDAMFAHAKTRFGRVDIWVNNAGVGHPYKPVWQLDQAEIRQVIDINVLGLMYSTAAALRGMREQGFGHVYTMEGFGSNGNIRSNALFEWLSPGKAFRRFLFAAFSKRDIFR